MDGTKYDPLTCISIPVRPVPQNLMSASLVSYQNNLHMCGPVELILSSTVRNGLFFALFWEEVSKPSYITIDTHTSGTNLLIIRSTQKSTLIPFSKCYSALSSSLGPHVCRMNVFRDHRWRWSKCDGQECSQVTIGWLSPCSCKSPTLLYWGAHKSRWATELMSPLSFMPKENMGLDLDTLVELGYHSQARYEGGVLSHQG